MSNRYKAAAPRHKPSPVTLRCGRCHAHVATLFRVAETLPSGRTLAVSVCLDCQTAYNAAPVRVTPQTSRERDV